MRGSFPHWADSRVDHSGEGEHASRAERLLCALGADPGFVEAVLGDLAEERAARCVADGPRAASSWYVREALRSSPHLVASAVRVASWSRRAAAMLGLGAVGFAVTFAVRGMLGDGGVPAQLLAAGDSGDGVVVNNVKPVRLTMQVLDSAGRVLPDTGIRYRWLSGTPVPVTSHGVATCTQSGDAIVGASLGPLTTRLVLRCRPVHRVSMQGGVNLIVGDSPVAVPFRAFDAQGRAVSLLRGEFSVEDSSVATLDVAADGTRLVRARAPGYTRLHIQIGDRSEFTGMNVYERASSPEGIHPGQYVATRVELAAGEVRQWHIPAGLETFQLAMRPYGDGKRVPALAIVGANCVTEGERSFMCVTLKGASLFVFHSRQGDQTRTVRGTLVVSRASRP